MAKKRSGQPSGGELVAEVLLRQGVRHLFTLCGGHISPILVAAKRRGIRVVDTRHEATAVFAADAVARLTGLPGVAAVTAGPGVTNTLTALQNAALAQTPLVLLGGATATVLKGRGALQDIDQLALTKPVVKWQTSVAKVAELVPALEQAFRAAVEGVPGPVFVECPVDLLYAEPMVRGWYGGKSGSGGSFVDTAVRWYLGRHLDGLFDGVDSVRTGERVAAQAIPAERGSVGTASLLLEHAERPVLLVGSQALLDPPGADALAAAVAALGVPVYLSGMARGLLGPDHPLQMRHHRKEALREADLVLLAGTPCDFRLDYGRHVGRNAVLVSVNRDKGALTKNRRPALAVNAAPDLFLRALAESRPEGFHRPGWAGKLRSRDDARDAEIASKVRHARTAGTPGVDPLLACHEMEDALPPSGVVVADGGDFVATAAYVLRPRRPLSWLDPGVFGTLGVGAGFALGAKLCRPDADVLLVWGDGSAGYGLAELDTFVRHGLGVVAVVGNDASWSQIARDQVEVLGDDVGTVLRPTDYHTVAAGFGGEGIVVTRASEMAPALARAFRRARAGVPVLVNVLLGKSDFRKGSISI